MLNTQRFGEALQAQGYDFFSGVPCSFLKDLINYAMNNCDYYAAANEGDAVAICAGATLAGKKAVVLLQNSGLGNTVSPLTSLNYCFRIPVLGFVSLRGEEGIPDEPQHELMGQITTALLDTMRISWTYLANDATTAEAQLKKANAYMAQTQLPFFFVVKKNTFEKVAYNEKPVPYKKPQYFPIDPLRLSENPKRQDCLEAIVAQSDNSTALLATTGKTGRELFETKDAPNHFYQVGSMGCISAIGLGIAVSKPTKKIIVIDGDGAALMRMGNFPTLGHYRPNNLLHIVLDNGVHDSTGGQATVSSTLDFAAIAQASGYPVIKRISSTDHLGKAISEWKIKPELTFLHIPISKGSKAELGRPTVKPHEVKLRFMEALANE